MNKVILVGRLTRDPEVRYTQTGKAVASFSIAVNTGFGDNKRADFVPIVVWDKLAEICGNNLTKGRNVLVEGRLQISEYEKDGQKRRTTEVVAQNVEFLESKQAVSGNTNAASTSTSPAKSGYDVSSFGTEVFPEEEIPF
ncbi:single-stranded DNA-binding protein [Pelosinus sp. sgz500959]|uniref:single-stranded DNA-binding protein n=1 Tax=Pelosinus sp. sgz500959 TaxID=3242472 RepID=UPI00366B6145